MPLIDDQYASDFYSTLSAQAQAGLPLNVPAEDVPVRLFYTTQDAALYHCVTARGPVSGNEFVGYLPVRGNDIPAIILKRDSHGVTTHAWRLMPPHGPHGIYKFDSLDEFLLLPTGDLTVKGSGHEAISGTRDNALWECTLVGVDEPWTFGRLPLPVPNPGVQTFTDVPPSHPLAHFVEVAAAAGWISGHDCGGPDEPCDAQHRPYFHPAGNVTRAQLCKILVLALQQNG